MLLDIIYIPLIMLLGLGFINKFSVSLTLGHRKTLRYLFFYHLVFGVYYCTFLMGDSKTYWNIANHLTFAKFLTGIRSGNGTDFLNAFTYPFANLLKMSYLSTTLVFSLLGFIGFTFFYIVTLKTVPYNRLMFGFAIFPVVFFLPNLHLWSVAIGKDTLMFLSIAMFAFGILKPKPRLLLIILSLLLAFAVRPHVLLFLLVAFGLSFIISGNISVYRRIGFGVILLGLGLALLPIVLEYIKLDNISSDAVAKRAEMQAGNLTEGSGSGVDVSNYPLLFKILTYLYRPLFFDARNIGGLLSSLDNLMLLILTVKALKFKPLQTFRRAPFLLKAFLIFGVLGTFAFSSSLGNLGIMIRMKNMFTPGILIYFMWCYSYRVQNLKHSTPKVKNRKFNFPEY